MIRRKSDLRIMLRPMMVKTIDDVGWITIVMHLLMHVVVHRVLIMP